MKRLALLFTLLLGACAPQLQPPGTDSAAPRLLADRMIMNDGVALPLRQWQPAGEPKAVILALHGFNDYSYSFDAPAKTWAAAGIATYAYDQRGFGATAYRGLWAGEDRMMADLRAAAALLRARYPTTPLYLLGESMGGSVVMAAAASTDPPAADGLILAAPAIWGRETQGPIQSGALWLAAHTMPWAELTGEGLHIHPSDNIAMLRELGRDPLVIKETRVDAIYGLVNLMDRAYEAAPRLRGRTLVLYGSREDILPGSAVVAMLRRLPADATRRPCVALYPKGYHMLLRDLDAATVRDDIVAWIADPVAPLPSGSDALAQQILATDNDDSLKAEQPVIARK
ncbi:MAG TPA: alpha/beta hydrolase [Candidatus Angelobacter sp.]|nr:alpha/beta hydrolase [Candidatus Angelobacter sp.]